MRVEFRETTLPGVVEVVAHPHEDDRGWIGEAFEKRQYGAAGLPTAWLATKFAASRRGVLRGLHWQRAPHGQGKLVACHYGEVFDVAVDIRDGSPTYLQWVGLTLSHERRNLVYVPPGFAHGVLTLSDESRISYSVCCSPHVHGAECGIRFDDPCISVVWPIAPTVSACDSAWPDFLPA